MPRPFRPNTYIHGKGKGWREDCAIIWMNSEWTDTKQTTGVRSQPISRTHAHTHTYARTQTTLAWPATNHWQTQHACPKPQKVATTWSRFISRSQKTKHKKNTKQHRPLHSSLNDQSRPSPCIWDHTVAAMSGRGVGGHKRKDERRGEKASAASLAITNWSWNQQEMSEID